MSRGKRVLLLVGVGLGLCIIFGMFVMAAFFKAVFVPSEAMAPTLASGDRVLARSVSGDKVSRGDVIVYRAPEADPNGSHERISRVVAVAGDEIGEEGGAFTVNGKRAVEPWLPDGTITAGVKAQQIPPGHVFVMSDNRPRAKDSRFYGPVSHENIRGLVVFRVWPLGSAGGV